MNMHFTDLQTIASAAAEWVGHAALFGTLLAGVTWLLLKVPLRRSRMVVHSAFWIVVLIKFLLPAGPSWSWSLATATRTIGKMWHTTAPATTPSSAARGASGLWMPMDDMSATAGPTGAAGSLRAWPVLAVLGALYLTGLLALVTVRLWA